MLQVNKKPGGEKLVFWRKNNASRPVGESC